MPNFEAISILKTHFLSKQRSFAVLTMFLLTEVVPTVFFDKYVHDDGLGFWTDPQSGRTYFYRACGDTTTNPDKPSFVFRFDVHDPTLRWYFVGKLDFWCTNADVSPCGRYFWSLELCPHDYRRGPAQLIFRQIDPNTLQCTKFDVTPAELRHDIVGRTTRSTKLRHTKHAGTLLFVSTVRFLEDRDEHTDLIYKIHVDQDRKQVRFERIQFPELSSAGYYPLSRDETYFTRITSIGIFEDNYSLFFYQIDYFGDLFILECRGFVNEADKWIKVTIEGDKFEPVVLMKDYNLLAHPLINGAKWIDTWNRLWKYTNFTFNGSFVCYGHGKNVHLYQLDFKVEQQICRSTQLFSILVQHVERHNLFLLPDSQQLKTPEMLIFYAFGQKSRWTKINVHKIAPLFQLAYWAATDLLAKREHESKMANEFMEIAVTPANNESRWSRICQRICCWFAGTETSESDPPTQQLMQRNCGKKDWPIRMSCSGSSQVTTIMPIVHGADAVELLQKLNKFCRCFWNPTIRFFKFINSPETYRQSTDPILYA